ncbi:hypothetical protein SteCoe_2260 [Stentor coeruleus]|uniref:Uncharacterized protein n=1 Tax=Stentor coeruleus TaxID=5963 RepID=A0A1R2CZR7_9CILI|nr:hypothetical protein SteCoe_2260 [Stentor coeruleus]
MGKSQSKNSDLKNLNSSINFQGKIDASNSLIQQLKQLPFKNQSNSNSSKQNILSFEQKIISLKKDLSYKKKVKKTLFQGFSLDFAFADSSIAKICLMKSCNAVVVLHGEFIKLWNFADVLPSKTLCIGRCITGMSITNNEKYIIYSTERNICAWDYENNEQFTFPFDSYIKHCQIIPSKDNRYIACGLSENILLFDFQSMEKIIDTTLENFIVECIALTNDNKYILSVVSQKYITHKNPAINSTFIYSLFDKNIINDCDFIKFPGLTIKISDDNNYLVTDSNDKTIRVWNLKLILNNFEDFKQYQESNRQYQESNRQHCILKNYDEELDIPKNKSSIETNLLKYKISEKIVEVSLRNQYRFEITKDNKHLLIYNEIDNEFQLYDIITMDLEKKINYQGSFSYSFFILSYDFHHFFVPEHPFVLKKLSFIDSKVTSYNFFGSGIFIQSFCLSANYYLFTCFSTNYNNIKISPFTVYNLETDQHVCFCIDNEYALITAAVFHKISIAVVSCRNSSISLWNLALSKVIKSICGIQGAQIEISEDDKKIILFDDQCSIIILDAFSLEKLCSFNSDSMIIMKVYTEISIVFLENQFIKVFNLNNRNHREVKKFPVITKSEKYCIASSLSRDKIYVLNIHSGNEIIKAF